jgi:hypothetical protein
LGIHQKRSNLKKSRKSINPKSKNTTNKNSYLAIINLWIFIYEVFIMKVKAIHIVLVVILTLIVVLFSTSSSIVPYSKDTLFSHMYKYEGMSTISADVQENHKKEEQPQPQSVFQKITGMLSGNQENAKAPEPGKKMVEGFALQPSPLDSSEAIDRYSKVSASPSCFGKSSGYSNSMGPLCISGEELRLLSTRGGNVTGTDSVIGH